ncbi:hypothetical protein [Pseudomonas monteilii]|uniref:hypothetical protein n=1 Tax=Pseudomonas monteilii TaxID=76759 RepID=UPI001FCF8D1B|nr:hypothetical protein [Pseudomonas monteilii]MCJ7853000.1 hypothetical protein [Pseudomonas monteilii]
MANLIDISADHAATILHAQEVNVPHTALKEVIAAYFGYESFATFAEEGSVTLVPYQLQCAEAVVLNLQMGTERAIELCDVPEPCLNACIEGIERACRSFAYGENMAPIPVFRSFEDFYYRHARAVTKRCLIEEVGENVAAEASNILERVEGMSSTKAGTANELILTTRCTIQGEDEYVLPVKCTTTFSKAGRAGLIFKSFDSNLRSMGQHAVLEVFTSDIRIKISDGSEGPAKFALIINKQCGTILGYSVGIGDEVKLAERVMHITFRSPARWRAVVEQLTSKADQFTLDTDNIIGSAHLREIGRHLNVSVRSRRNHQHSGRIERLAFSFLKDWRRFFGQAKKAVPLEDLAQFLEVSISIVHEHLDAKPLLTPYELWKRYLQQSSPD